MLLDNPQMPLQPVLQQAVEKSDGHIVKFFKRRILRSAKNDDTRRMAGRETQNIGEIQVQSYQAAALAAADLKQVHIRATGKVLFSYSVHVMASLDEQVQSTASQILVQLELHAALESGRSMKRSRLISAP